MKIGEMMTREVTVCRLDETLETAANLFWTRDVGVLPIIDSRVRVVGLLTDRDICLTAMFRALPLKEIPVGETMSETIVSCTVDDTLEAAAQKMADAKVRRLVVLDSEGRLEGIVGLSDLARVTLDDKLTVKSAEVVLNTILAINTPHGVETVAQASDELIPEAAPVKKAEAKAKLTAPKLTAPKATAPMAKAAPKAAKPETLVVPKAAAPKTSAAVKPKATKVASKPAAKAKAAKAPVKGKAKASAKPGKSARKS
ncbi:MAG: CBS domain-containing protein [Planctomycetota bacterium]|jgi:CBS domain-containing protein